MAQTPGYLFIGSAIKEAGNYKIVPQFEAFHKELLAIPEATTEAALAQRRMHDATIFREARQQPDSQADQLLAMSRLIVSSTATAEFERHVGQRPGTFKQLAWVAIAREELELPVRPVPTNEVAGLLRLTNYTFGTLTPDGPYHRYAFAAGVASGQIAVELPFVAGNELAA